MAAHLIYIRGHFRTASHPWASHIHRWHLWRCIFQEIFLAWFSATLRLHMRDHVFRQLLSTGYQSRAHLHPRCVRVHTARKQEVLKEGWSKSTGALPTLYLSTFPPKALFSPATLPINTHRTPPFPLLWAGGSGRKATFPIMLDLGVQGLPWEAGRTNTRCISPTKRKGLLRVRSRDAYGCTEASARGQSLRGEVVECGFEMFEWRTLRTA